MGEIKYDVISKELDDMAIKMLRLMQDYIDVKRNLEELIKTGRIHLAKSRYIMGNKTVSALQLPTEDSSVFYASSRVVQLQDEAAEDKLCCEFEKISLKDTSKQKSSLRSRSSPSETPPTDEVPNEDDIHINIPDPLKWFGVLVPQDMRLAQSSFNTAVDYSVQCVNIQLAINKLREQYLIKLKEKEKLKMNTNS